MAEMYPDSPGHGRGRFTDTAFDASQAIQPVAGTLRAKALRAIAAAANGLTGSEVALAIGCDLYSARPRCTELLRLGKIRDSGERRKVRSRCSEIVWMVAPNSETA